MRSFHDADYVNGKERGTDSETVAEYLAWPYWFWAGLRFVFPLVMFIVMLILAPDPFEGPLFVLYQERFSSKESIVIQVF